MIDEVLNLIGYLSLEELKQLQAVIKDKIGKKEKIKELSKHLWGNE
jgi:hypothetical protein